MWGTSVIYFRPVIFKIYMNDICYTSKLLILFYLLTTLQCFTRNQTLILRMILLTVNLKKCVIGSSVISYLYHITSHHIISYHIISYHIISYHIISYHIISYHIILNFIPISYIKTNRHKKHNMILRTWSKGHKFLRKIMPLTKVSTKIYRNLQNNTLYK